MKKIYNLLLAAMLVTVVGFTACGESGIKRYEHGALITNQADIDHAVAYVTPFVGEKLVTRVSFVPKTDERVMLNAGYVRVYYYENEGANEMKVLLCPITADGKEPYEETTYPAGHKGMDSNEGVMFSQIDFSKVAEYVSKAGALMVAESGMYEEEINFSGFSYVNMDFDKDPKNPYYKFALESKDFETSTEYVDEYYEFVFEVIDGELISEDGLGEGYDDGDMDEEGEDTEDVEDMDETEM